MNARTLERVYELAMQIADEAARIDIESDCLDCTRADGHTWYEVHKPEAHTLLALEYLELRGLIEYDSTGTLVRFIKQEPG